MNLPNRTQKLFIPVTCIAFISCGPHFPKTGTAPVPVSRNEKADIPKSTDDGLAFLSDFAPYFDGVRNGEAAALLAEDKLADALTAFDEIILTTSDIRLTPRARFLSGYIAERIGDDTRAVHELLYAAEELPTVADLAWERAARAALRLGQCEEALRHAEKVEPSSPFASDAAMTRADALRFLKRPVDAEAAYQAYLDKWPNGSRRNEARSRLVECAAQGVEDKSAKRTDMESGLAMLQQMQADSPSAYWTRQAEAFEEILMKGLGVEIPTDRPARRAALDAFEKALALKSKMKNEAAEREFNNVIRLAKHNSSLLCRARFEQAVAVQQQREHGRAAGLFDGVGADCTEPSIRLRALYRGAKAYEAAGKTMDAIRLFEQVEADFPDGSLADDARLRAAQCYLDLGDKAKFKDLLQTLPGTYPSGDMRSEALWTLALDAISRGDWVAAKEALTPYYELFPKEKGWYAAGRSGYWLARAEEQLGDTINAASHYEHVIAVAPFSFYMVLAYNRLLEMDADRAQKLILALAPKGEVAELKFRRTLFDEYPAFGKAVELHRLGLVSCAKRAFDQLLSVPEIPAEIHWIVAALQRRAGRYAESKEIATGGNGGWEDRYPVKEDMLPWTLAYPTVFEEIVENAADTASVSPHLIWAVMREESGFNPKVESWANAMGLMQLILPTAKSMGKQLGITVTRGSLRKPEVNIPLGTAYLARLQNLFAKHPVLSVAGYNAGEGAVARWLKNRTDKTVDLFVEQIPYDQTRGYTKRVIGTFAAYTFLYSEDPHVVEFPLLLP